jgi:hypothetical protein
MLKCTSDEPTGNRLSDLDPLTVDAVLTPYIISTFLDMLISPTARHVFCSVLYLHSETTICLTARGASLKSPVELFPTNYGSRYDHDSLPDDVSPDLDIEVGLMLMFVDSIMIIHAKSDCCGCHICAFMCMTLIGPLMVVQKQCVCSVFMWPFAKLWKKMCTM